MYIQNIFIDVNYVFMIFIIQIFQYFMYGFTNIIFQFLNI